MTYDVLSSSKIKLNSLNSLYFNKKCDSTIYINCKKKRSCKYNFELTNGWSKFFS